MKEIGSIKQLQELDYEHAIYGTAKIIEYSNNSPKFPAIKLYNTGDILQMRNEAMNGFRAGVEVGTGVGYDRLLMLIFIRSDLKMFYIPVVSNDYEQQIRGLSMELFYYQEILKMEVQAVPLFMVIGDRLKEMSIFTHHSRFFVDEGVDTFPRIMQDHADYIIHSMHDRIIAANTTGDRTPSDGR